MENCLTCKVKELEEIIRKKDKEIKKLKKTVNSVNALKNYYMKKCENFDEEVNKKVEVKINKIVDNLNHQHELELMKKNQEIHKLTTLLNLNSKNSSIPSSKEFFIKFAKNIAKLETNAKETKNESTDVKVSICNSRKKSDKSIGGQPNHTKHMLEKFDESEIDVVNEHTIEKCDFCGSSNLKLIDVKIRDCVDIKISVVKTRHKFYEYLCRDCGKIIKAKIPLNLHADNQYGSTVQALALALTNIGYVSLNRTKALISSLTNNQINMSEGYIASLSKKVVSKTDDFNSKSYNKILTAKVNHWDDTVVKIGKNNSGCFRVYVNKDCVYYTAHNSKSVKGVEEDGILKNLPASCFLMHDHYRHNYNRKYKFTNLECNSHSTRNLEGITQATYHNWSRDMKELIENTYIKREQNIKNKIDCFTVEEIEQFNQEYDKILERGYKEYNSTNSNEKISKEKNMLNFMKEYKEPLTLWVKNYELPYSNNLAERSFRFLKSKLKISYQFKSLDNVKYFARIMSYIETCNKYGANKFEAMKRLFDNKPYTYEELEKLIPTT